LGGTSSFHVSNTENKCEEKAKCSDSDVAHGEEIVLTTQGISGRDNKFLLTLERCHFIGVLNLDVIFTFVKSRINSAPKFSEVRETGGSHPNDEMFICHIKPLERFPRTCTTFRCVFEVSEFILFVGSPSNLVLLNSYFCVIATIRVLFEQLESIIEEGFGNKTTWDSWIFSVKLFPVG